MIHNSGGQSINGTVLLDFLATRDKTRKVKPLVGALVINISVFSPVIKGETNQCDPFLFWDKTYRSVVIVLRRKKSGLCIKSHIALVAGSSHISAIA